MVQKICFLFLFFCITCSANAIHRPDPEDFSFGKGWFAGAQLGTQYYISDFNFHRNATLGYGFSSSVEGFVGKWLNPLVALRGNVSLNNVTTGEVVEQPHSMEPKIVTGSFNMIHSEMDVLLDLRCLLRGKGGVYSFRPLMGVGYAFNTSKHLNGASVSFGGINSWKLNEHLEVNVEAKVRLLEDEVDGCKNDEDVQFVLNAGLSYRF